MAGYYNIMIALEDKDDIKMMLGISTGSGLKLELAWTLSIDE